MNYPDSINHYIYCYNDPTVFVDNNGKMAVEATAGATYFLCAIIAAAFVAGAHYVADSHPLKLPDIDIFPKLPTNNTLITDVVYADEHSIDDYIDIFPQAQTQQPLIVTTPSSVSEEDIIIPFPSGRIIAPQLLTPWDVFPALTQQETSIWVIANGSYESGSSITGDAVVFGSATKSEEKVRRQMERRGWTEEDVRQTVDNPYTIRKSENKATGNSATVYYTKEGAYVTVDDVTNEIV